MSEGSDAIDYVFGYGSLIQHESRTRTLPDAESATPVRVRGLRREWNAPGPGPGLTTTFLGVAPDAGASCNGVLAAVTSSHWEALDRRERDYDRRPIDPSSIEHLVAADSIPPDARIFAYFTTQPAAPDAERPIIQSYVDICLDGCLAVDAALGGGEDFTLEFLRSTAGWNHPWVNDRLYPRAPFRTVPRAGTIDRLLAEGFPEAFARIRIE